MNGGRVGVLAVCVFLSATIARGEPPAPGGVATAKEHYVKGSQLYDLGRYIEAVEQYEQAFRLSNRPGFLFNIGQAYRLAGKAREAIAAYEGFVRRDPSSPLKAEAQRHVATLQAKLDEEARAAQPPKAPPEPAPPPRVSEPVVVTPSIVVDPKPAPRSRRWIWGVVAGSIVVAAGLGIGLGVGLTAGPKYPRPTEGGIDVGQ